VGRAPKVVTYFILLQSKHDSEQILACKYDV